MGAIVSPLDIQNEGVNANILRVTPIIAYAEQYVERVTGYRFYRHTAAFALDGNDRDTLILPQPMITLTSVTLDGSVLTAGVDYLVYNRRPPGEDDRLYPRLVRLPQSSASSPWGGMRVPTTPWPKGALNVVVSGTFGFTDNIGGTVNTPTDPPVLQLYTGGTETPPYEIKRQLTRLVILELALMGVEEEEVMRRVHIYAQSFGEGGLSTSLSTLAVSGGPTGVPEIDKTLWRYTSPLRGQRPKFAFGGA